MLTFLLGLAASAQAQAPIPPLTSPAPAQAPIPPPAPPALDPCAWAQPALRARVAKDLRGAGNQPLVLAAFGVPAAPEAARAGAAECMQRRLAPALVSGADALVSTLLQTAGQLVVDRAVSNAWGLLRGQLRAAAGCASNPPVFGHVCAALTDVRLQDLIASPQVLLDAALKDIFEKLSGVISKQPAMILDLGGAQVSTARSLSGAFTSWRDGGPSSTFAYLRAELVGLIVHASSDLGGVCQTALCQALRIVGDCLVSGDGQRAAASQCVTLAVGGAAADLGEARATAIVLGQALLEDNLVALVRLFTQELPRAGGTAVPGPRNALLASTSDLLEGIAAADWSRISVGASGALRAGTPLGLDLDKRHRRLFALLAGVGQYAATYATKAQNPDAVARARRQAIESLIDATTDRSGRDSGVVVSLGGDLGVGWGWRRGIRKGAGDVAAQPTPLHLSLGLGVDHYGSRHGIHAMLSVADLSQYVAFKDKSFTVADPDSKAALAIGATLGLRLGLSSTPWFVGANFTYAPFVRDPEHATNGSYQVLLMTAIYVPFFDFN